jgi:formylglycine-generating enzyme required for sulfatase activity
MLTISNENKKLLEKEKRIFSKELQSIGYKIKFQKKGLAIKGEDILYQYSLTRIRDGKMLASYKELEQIARGIREKYGRYFFFDHDPDTKIDAFGFAFNKSPLFHGIRRDGKISQYVILVPQEERKIMNTIGFINSVGMELLFIKSGSFIRKNSERRPPRRIVISRSFYLSKYPVTQEQWSRVMGYNPSHFKGSDNPVENVQFDINNFISKLNKKERMGGYRLPTEAEWEYAARAGTEGEYFFGDDPALLERYAWYEENSGGRTHPVGEKLPNPWGLHDLYGNVEEMTQDLCEYRWKDDIWGFWNQPDGPPFCLDPRGPSLSESVPDGEASFMCRMDGGIPLALRGGCWNSSAEECCSDAQSREMFNSKPDYFGFRLVFSVYPHADME